MKEHITIKQLKELTIDQSIKLKSMWCPKTHDIIMVKDKTFTFNKLHFKTDVILDDYDTFKGFCMPLLSIGQCLEILEQHFSCISICIISQAKEKFCLHLWKDESDFENEPLIISRENNIDALWEGVKLVLRNYL